MNVFVLLLILLFPAVLTHAGDQVHFNEQVRPILSKHCIACHGPDEGNRQAELRLDIRESATADLGGHVGIVPGDATQSEIIKRISSDDESIRMPPVEHSEPLKSTEIETLRRWINEGAEYQRHWSFVTPQPPSIPNSAFDAWAANPLDRFVAVAMVVRGLKPNEIAEAHVLVRRVALALTGLPPTRSMVERYVANPSSFTYQRIVDELLQSPAFGEHWASVWLDLARYADTIGYSGDEERSIWPWRDLVIAMLNENKLFDDFTRELIAGDLIADATNNQRLASAFHRNTLNNNEGGTIDEEFRTIAVKDRLSTTINTWMGLTIRCAECHSHKYDPISQLEYYSMLDFFNQTADTDTRDELPVMQVALLANGVSMPAPLKVPVMVDMANDQRRKTHLMRRGNFRELGEQVDANTPAAFPSLPPSLPKNRLALAEWIVSQDNPLTARVAANRIWSRLFGIGIVETEEDFGTQGMMPTHPELLDYLATNFVANDWDVKRLIRLIVTSSTFCQSSFASERVHQIDPRNLYLSRGPRFRLSAEVVRDQTLAVSGLLTDKLYGPPVFPPSAIKRIVNSFTGGMEWKVSVGADRYRRAIYTFLKRSQPHPLFETFDMATREVCNLRRLRTNTPLQSFMTLNDPAFIEAAQTLARSMLAASSVDDVKDDGIEMLTVGWQKILLRAPTTQELQSLRKLYTETQSQYRRSIEEAAIMAGVDRGSIDENDLVRLASLTVCANVMLNCDAFLCN